MFAPRVGGFTKPSYAPQMFYCQVMGIPQLVILGPDGQLVCDNARGSVAADPEGDKFPWAGMREPK